MNKLINTLKPAGLVIVYCSALFSYSALADIAVIANTDSASSNLSIKDVKKIFLGKNTSMTPVDQPDGNATRNAFYQKAAKKNESQMKAYWSKMIFSGKAIPPETSANDASVITWVTNNKNGIGYIDSASVDGSVKILLTIK